jgi:transcription antitermination protein NusB
VIVVDAPKSGGDETRKRSRGARTRGRSLALQMVYSYEQNHYDADARLIPSDDLAEVDEEARGFANELFDGFCAQRTPVDAAIDKRLVNWTIGRLSVIDRAILRLGAYELLYCSGTPPKVAINEYIELAKRFGTESNTARLVNGVLDKVARDHRQADKAAANTLTTDS